MNKTGCCFIVPSSVLLKLADKKSNPAEKKALIDAALLSEHIRGQRTVRALVSVGSFAGQKERTVFDCQNLRPRPPQGVARRAEDEAPSGEQTVDFAYDHAGITYDFYREILNRNSIDGQGMRLDSFVHFGNGYNNAFWDGAEMVYGDGDQQQFLGFAQSLDVVAHELSHGVTEFSVPGGGLEYVDQSGALNESFSDVFGSVVKQWHKNQDVVTADWLIGDGIMGPQVGRALRSMKSPGDTSITWFGDDQPQDMDGYVDGGDVHTNSGIPNRAFYLAATTIGGKSWEKSARIWYRALSMLHFRATFAEAAQATISAATLLFGEASERDAVRDAWTAVKVL